MLASSRVPVLLVLALAACPPPRAEVAPRPTTAATPRPSQPRDPARIDGRWHYRTRTGCDPSEGVGEVTFTWDRKARLYAEQGFIYWASHRRVFRWWGRDRYLAAARRLEGQLQNSLGDTVEASWELGEHRLLLRWKQSNGCQGEGAATPREGLLAGLKLRRLLLQLRDGDSEQQRVEAAQELGQMGRQATAAVPPLVDSYHAGGSPALARAIWEALEAIRR